MFQILLFEDHIIKIRNYRHSILASQVFSVRIAPHQFMGSDADRKHLASEDAGIDDMLVIVF